MSASSPGARTWWAPATIAIRSARLALALLAAPGSASADDAIDRIVAAASFARLIGLPGATALRRACGGDALCAADRIAARLGPGAWLERVRHPDTDTIRWVVTAPSVVVHETATGPRRIEIRRFERKVLPELRAALARASADASRLILDLRRNRGGDFERMLEVAGLLLGPHSRALALHEADRVLWRGLEGTGTAQPVRQVLIGPSTASSAEVLAALLAAYGGARLCGTGRTAGKDDLQSVVQVEHEWRLLITRARIEVPGMDLAGGLMPDRTCRPHQRLGNEHERTAR